MLSITKTLVTLYRESRAIHRYFLVSFVCAILSTVGTRTIVPVIAAGLYDAAYAENFQLVLHEFVLLVVVFFASGACDRLYDFSTVKYQSSMFGHLRSVAVKSILSKPVSFFTNTYVGSLVAKVNRLPRSFETIGDQTFTVVSVITMMISTTVVLYGVNPYLGICFFVWFTTFIYISYRFSNYVAVTDLDESSKESLQTAMLADTMNMAPTAITLAGTDEALRRYEEANKSHENALYKTWIRSNIRRAFMSECPRLFLLAAIFGAIYFCELGLIPVSTLIVVYAYATNTMSLFNDLVRVFAHTLKSISDAKEMIDILEVPAETGIHSSCNFVLKRGDIEFKGVTFAHPGRERLFEGLNIKILHGTKVGIVGTSGSGKTTLTQMIMRHLLPSSGEIFFDGIPASEISKESIRKSIAIIPQEIVMAGSSVAYNIAQEKNPDMGRVMQAAQMAHIHDDIMNMPDGYNTLVGERGVRLSGGQRQRIGTARAFYRNPVALIMDEATSALDASTETAIRETIAELQGVTLLVIAHRLATVRDCDVIFVMEEGRVIESGSHEELIELGGIYARFVSQQIDI